MVNQTHVWVIDAPLLWQLGLFLVFRELSGVSSLLDENFYYWLEDYQLEAVVTIYVDDLLVAATDRFMTWALAELERRYGTIKRQKLPFTHTGILMSRLADGGILWQQNEGVLALDTIKIAKGLHDVMPCTPEMQFEFRSLLASLLYLSQRHIEILCGVVQLQSYNNSANVGHVRQANTLLNKAKANLGGIHFAALEPPFVLRDFNDASGHTRNSSYAHEGTIVLLCNDNRVVHEHDTLDQVLATQLTGGGHILAQQSRKARRVSHSTSHGETLAGVGGLALAQMIAIRYTEIFFKFLFHRLPVTHDLLKLELSGHYVFPIDVITDCFDLLELVTGARGIPQDKTQRLAVLSLREERLSGRVRFFMHWPTNVMIADALTKTGKFDQLTDFLHDGVLRVDLMADKFITVRRLTSKPSYTEDDLVNIGDFAHTLGRRDELSGLSSSPTTKAEHFQDVFWTIDDVGTIDDDSADTSKSFVGLFLGCSIDDDTHSDKKLLGPFFGHSDIDDDSADIHKRLLGPFSGHSDDDRKDMIASEFLGPFTMMIRTPMLRSSWDLLPITTIAPITCRVPLMLSFMI